MASQNKNSESNQESVKLLHGQFYVYDKLPENVVVDRLVNPLSQEEIADRWRMVLPRPSKNRPVHHYNVYLSYLPEHLWCHLKLYTNSNGITQYRLLRDNIYNYSIKQTPSDSLLFDLYREVTNYTINNGRIRELLNNSDLQNYKHGGWLILRARRMIS